MPLTDIVDSGKKVLSNLNLRDYTNTALVFASTAGILYGEYLQGLAMNGLRDYDLWQGHLSDFSTSAWYTAYAI